MFSIASTLFLLFLSTAVQASLYYRYGETPQKHYFFDPHPKVLEVDSLDNFLPDWQKSPTLKNVAFLMVHPLYSYPQHGEEIVHDRPTDKVERDEIYSMLIHAGFIQRNPIYHSRFKIKGTKHWSLNKSNQDHKHVDPEYHMHSDILQYL